MIDDEEEEDEEELTRQQTTQAIVTSTVMAATWSFLQLLHQHNIERRPLFTRRRVNWEEHVRDLLKEGNEFRKDYRMSHASFNKLCNILRPSIQVDEEMSRRRTGQEPISPEMMLHCLIRYLAGGSLRDIRLVVGISSKSFYGVVYQCVNAILKCDELQYNFPTSNEDVSKVASDFSAISANGLIQGCVGCMDGLLIRISAPSLKQAKNPKAYYSGHYQDYGMNIQAICDSQCRFTYASVAAPGGWNDLAVYRNSSIAQQIEKLPLGKYIVADNAYICTEHVLTPYSGSQKKDVPKDAYNFFLSQVRIRIEMTFGRFLNKWRFFGRPVQCKLHNIGKLFLCASQLHNFCTNECLLEEERDGIQRKPGTPPAMVSDGPDEALMVPPTAINDDLAPETPDTAGNSFMREILVAKVVRRNLRRPQYNLMRNSSQQE